MTSNADSRDLKLVGSIIHGRFLVKSRLAAGGMGVVYEGEQVPLGRPVAIKILENKADHAQEQNFNERFLLEAAAVAKLSHPNTITLYDYGQTDDEDFYYAMEFVDGATLSRRVYDDGPLDSSAAIHVGMQVAGSLREAHRAGMIHRDLKPGNIMLTDRLDDPFFVKVLDFGLVKVMGQSEGVELTQSGMLMGSPRYMAPEQVLGHPLDARADIYSFGSVMYLALTGYPPFRHGSQFEVLRAQVEESPPPFDAANPDHVATERLENLVYWCLRKDRNERPQSMDEVAQELRLCAREIGIEETSLSGAVRTMPSGEFSAEHPLPVSAGMAAAAAARAEESPSPQPAPAVATAASGPPVEPSGHVVEPSFASSPDAAPRSRALLAVAGVALVVVAGAAGAFAYLSPFGGTPTVATETPTPLAAPEPAPVDPPAAARRVEVVSEPPGARVRRGDVDLGDAPFSVQIPDDASWELTFTLDGHEPRTVLATADRDRIQVRLTAVGADPEASETDAPTGESSTGRTQTRPRRPVAAAPPPTPQPFVPTPTPLAPAPVPVAPVTAPAVPAPAPSGRQRDLRNPWGG